MIYLYLHITYTILLRLCVKKNNKTIMSITLSSNVRYERVNTVVHDKIKKKKKFKTIILLYVTCFCNIRNHVTFFIYCLLYL